AHALDVGAGVDGLRLVVGAPGVRALAGRLREEGRLALGSAAGERGQQDESERKAVAQRLHGTSNGRMTWAWLTVPSPAGRCCRPRWRGGGACGPPGRRR